VEVVDLVTKVAAASPFAIALIGVVVLYKQNLVIQAKVEALTERYHVLVTEHVKVLQDIADKLEGK